MLRLQHNVDSLQKFVFETQQDGSRVGGAAVSLQHAALIDDTAHIFSALILYPLSLTLVVIKSCRDLGLLPWSANTAASFASGGCTLAFYNLSLY